jgi:hypothetical protein
VGIWDIPLDISTPFPPQGGGGGGVGRVVVDGESQLDPIWTPNGRGGHGGGGCKGVPVCGF